MRTSFILIISAAFLLFQATRSHAQQPAQPGGGQPIDIIHADSISLKKVDDSTNLTILEGAVLMKQGNTTFKCDRCEKNDRAKTFEAWGNVHINNSDTTNIYSEHLRYLTDKEIAYLDKNVRLTDGHATLTTPALEYNMNTNIATYKNGGKVVNKKTVITSKEAFYYTDIKDVYFKKNVLVNDPAYRITTDSLLYNTENQTARFISQTLIRDSANKTINTRDGFYNLKTGEAQFGQRPIIDDGNKTTIIADNVSLNNSIAKAEGNAIIVDSTRGTTIIGNLIYQNRTTEAILATQKPLMIIKQGEDSIYVTADTLFSAKLTDLYIVSPALGGDSIRIKPDSTSLNDSLKQGISVLDSITTDSTQLTDSTTKIAELQPALQDSVKKSQVIKPGMIDSVATMLTKVPRKLEVKKEAADSSVLNTTKLKASDTTTQLQTKPLADNDSTNRYFEAFHNVKIYTDSVQAVSDSLFYSFKDSIFRLYQDPIMWGKGSQITGDTILLHTKNKQLHWFEAFKNGFMINQTDSQAFNQIKATRLDGYFTNGNLDSVRAKGSSEAIYFVQDDDSAYVGINQTTSDILDAYFFDKALKKIVLRSEVNGTFYPIKQKTPEEMRLKGFEWREALRPKTKYDLMQ